VRARVTVSECCGSVARASFTASLGLGLVVSGCIENHDTLAAKPTDDGAGGTYGVANRDASGGGGVAGDAGVAGDQGDGGAPPDEPTGPRTLTVVHGVIDSPVIAFCFAPVKAGVEVAVRGQVLPNGGLRYGRTAVFETLPDIDLAVDGVRPYLVAGLDPSAATSLDCAAVVKLSNAVALPSVPPGHPATDASVEPRDAAVSLDASVGKITDAALDGARDGAPAPHDASVPVPVVRAAAMPVIPAGQLAAELGYLLVASGCMGGTGVRDPSEQSICGDLYSASTPTLAPLLVSLPRTTKPNRVSLAFLDASAAFSHVDVGFTPPLHSDPLSLVQGVVTGALRPRPPSTRYAAEDIGAANALATLQLYPGGSDTAAYDALWQKTLRAGDLAGLENGSAYTLIYVGPFPAFAAKRWWNGPLVTIVKN
jgi:hypothetical protein